MLLRTLAALAMLAAPLALFAAEPENPYKKAEKGQWVSYKMTTKLGGMNIEGTMKQTVTAKDDKSVALEITVNFNGMDFPAQKQTIDLTKPFNPLQAASVPGGGDVKVEKKGNGKETIEAGGKKYDSEWTSFKVSAEVMGQKIEGDSKVWLSKDVPIGGIVKMESKMKAAGMEFETTMIMDKAGKD